MPEGGIPDNLDDCVFVRDGDCFRRRRFFEGEEREVTERWTAELKKRALFMVVVKSVFGPRQPGCDVRGDAHVTSWWSVREQPRIISPERDQQIQYVAKA